MILELQMKYFVMSFVLEKINAMNKLKSLVMVLTFILS